MCEHGFEPMVTGGGNLLCSFRRMENEALVLCVAYDVYLYMEESFLPRNCVEWQLSWVWGKLNLYSLHSVGQYSVVPSWEQELALWRR